MLARFGPKARQLLVIVAVSTVISCAPAPDRSADIEEASRCPITPEQREQVRVLLCDVQMSTGRLGPDGADCATRLVRDASVHGKMGAERMAQLQACGFHEEANMSYCATLAGAHRIQSMSDLLGMGVN